MYPGSGVMSPEQLASVASFFLRCGCRGSNLSCQQQVSLPAEPLALKQLYAYRDSLHKCLICPCLVSQYLHCSFSQNVPLASQLSECHLSFPLIPLFGVVPQGTSWALALL